MNFPVFLKFYRNRREFFGPYVCDVSYANPYSYKEEYGEKKVKMGEEIYPEANLDLGNDTPKLEANGKRIVFWKTLHSSQVSILNFSGNEYVYKISECKKCNKYA